MEESQIRCKIKNTFFCFAAVRFCIVSCLCLTLATPGNTKPGEATGPVELKKAAGYNGLWYKIGESHDEYKYKYSGGFATYPQQQIPMAIYRPEVEKTFFCYGGSDPGKQNLLHMIAFFDHATGKVSRPRILLDKQTDDAHDNPVISMDDDGYIYIFSPSHGTSRPSYISKSQKPYDISSFTIKSSFNFSYPQPKYIPGKGFHFLYTRYNGGRAIYMTTSKDGTTWEKARLVSLIAQGHYEISNQKPDGTVATSFNYHPKKGGLDARTNLYYMETPDMGKTWTTVDKKPLKIPLKTTDSLALVHDYEKENLLVYMKDIQFDEAGNPVIVYVTSRGHESGPKNDPRIWCITRWDGKKWITSEITRSDNNYDFGSLYTESDSTWKLIAPTIQGPQAYNPGGEVAMWTSHDKGASWTLTRQVTTNSPGNHTFVRRPVNAAPDFYAFWGDGNAREPSICRLFFTDKNGSIVRMLPEKMTEEAEYPMLRK